MGHRFMYENLISGATAISATSASPGFIGAGVPRVANGAGSMIFSGNYTGENDEVYLVEIDGSGDVGTATFKWRKTTTPVGSWEASGILTSTADTPLDSGVKVRFTNGSSSPAFQAGDRWQATATRFRSPKRIYDLDPNTKARSAAPPEDPWALVIDLNAAQAPDALILHKHNVSSGAVVKVQAHTADSWGAPSLEETITWQADTMFRYLTTAPRSYRFWRVAVEGDSANADGHIEVAEVYLGGYFEPADHFWFDNVFGEEAFEEAHETESKVNRTVLLNRGRSATLPYRHVSDAQRAQFLAMFQSIKDVENERSKPLFVHLDVDDPATLLFASMAGGFFPTQAGPDDFSFDLEMKERLT